MPVAAHATPDDVVQEAYLLGVSPDQRTALVWIHEGSGVEPGRLELWRKGRSKPVATVLLEDSVSQQLGSDFDDRAAQLQRVAQHMPQAAKMSPPPPVRIADESQRLLMLRKEGKKLALYVEPSRGKPQRLWTQPIGEGCERVPFDPKPPTALSAHWLADGSAIVSGAIPARCGAATSWAPLVIWVTPPKNRRALPAAEWAKQLLSLSQDEGAAVDRLAAATEAHRADPANEEALHRLALLTASRGYGLEAIDSLKTLHELGTASAKQRVQEAIVDPALLNAFTYAEFRDRLLATPELAEALAHRIAFTREKLIRGAASCDVRELELAVAELVGLQAGSDPKTKDALAQQCGTPGSRTVRDVLCARWASDAGWAAAHFRATAEKVCPRAP